MLKVGDVLDLGKRTGRSRFAPFNVVLHISRLEGNQYLFCVVPTVYAKKQLARDVELTLSPPEILNIEGLMPMPIEEPEKEVETEVEEGAAVEAADGE